MADEPSFFSREAFGGRFWSLIAAIVFVVAVAAGAIVVAATGGSSASPSHKAGGQPGCPLAAVVSDNIPTAAPPQTTWVDVRGFKLPVTPDGPLYHEDGHWSCYAHSPTGALEAAMGLAANALVGDRSAVQGMFAPGTVSAAQLDALVPPGGTQRQSGAKIIGFIYGGFSRQGGQLSVVDSCTISSCPSPIYSTEYSLTWAGHWLVNNGGGTTTPLSSTAGVTTLEAP